ncbi:Protein of unknown function [Cotesia congregata]|uniref:Uncharacterized protein n=1 Tax=Cotesia congregata TaxID=51543 RepID=A0A8J2EDG8_COTCN|nr:Protein of unknown function [Cotesia congregata]
MLESVRQSSTARGMKDAMRRARDEAPRRGARGRGRADSNGLTHLSPARPIPGDGAEACARKLYPTERHTGTSLQSGAHRLNSVEDSAEKVEGPGTQGAKESSNDSRDEDSANDISSTLSGLLAGLPALPGPQRLASSLRQRFSTNSGKTTKDSP